MNRCVRLNEGRHQEGPLKRRAKGGEEVGCAHLDPEFGQSSLLELVQLNANSILFTQNKPTQSKLSTPSSRTITKDIEPQASNLNTSTTKSSSIPSIQYCGYNSYSCILPFSRSNRLQVSNLNIITIKSSSQTWISIPQPSILFPSIESQYLNYQILSIGRIPNIPIIKLSSIQAYNTISTTLIQAFHSFIVKTSQSQVSNLNASTAKSSPFGSIPSISNRLLWDPKQISSRPLCYTYFLGRLSTRNFSPPSIRRAMAWLAPVSSSSFPPRPSGSSEWMTSLNPLIKIEVFNTTTPFNIDGLIAGSPTPALFYLKSETPNSTPSTHQAYQKHTFNIGSKTS